MSSQPARAFRPLPACCPLFQRLPPASRLASRLASCLSPSVPPLSRPVCCDSIATCPRFSSTFRLLPELPAHSRSVRLLHVCFPPCGAALFLTFPRPFLRFPVPYVAIPSQPARAFRPLSACCPLFQLFPPLTACLPIRPLFFLLLSPAWPGGNTEKALRDCSRRASD